MAYPYYPNNQIYMQNMQDLQNMREKIDRQMQQMQQLNQNQMQQQPVPNVTQNFQLAPNPTNNELESKYANNIDEVRNTFVMKTGVFVNKDFTSMWVKTTDGNIKTYELNEVIQQDPKDVEINNLKQEIQKMREMINYGNESNVNTKDVEINNLKQEIQKMREMINYGNESNVNNSNNDESNESKNAKKLSSRTKSNAK